ncbi:UbiD family decarboxylase [Novosphingobium sp. 9]|uniref:UbiD family decarboxylase n=1 Tax=Novosphingobium sp. 9 TaxID=2025349 RepID=UPI0021B61765|nr:UbiD family decarboxylase [Novosphingobium sp. 9]
MKADRTRTALSLRDWMERLQATGRLAIANPDRDLVHEVAAIANRLDGHKASVFPKVGAMDGTVICGLLSDRNWMAEALDVAPSELIALYKRACDEPVASIEVADAPVQEVVHTDVDILAQLPVPTHNEHDSGPYITAGLLISRDPETGVQNVTIHRCQISSRNRIGVLLLPRHTDNFFRKAKAMGKALEIAIVIGCEPSLMMASQAIVPLGHDELEIAGTLRGAALPVVKCKTNDVRVPAEAEIVVEGRILPDAMEPEGPFGEFPQYYGERDNRHVIEVDAITHRRDPLFHTIVGGGLEHLLLGAIPREASILATMRRSFPGVVDVALGLGGVGRYHLYIQLDKTQDGEGKNVLMAAFAAHYDIKHAVVVDLDVNIHDAREVEWAVATRFQADCDLLLVTESQGSKLDPSTRDGVGAKLGFDATIPVNAPEMKFKRIRVPGQAEVDLDAVLDQNATFKF